MINKPQLDAPSVCLRPIPPVALAACALIAGMTLLVSSASAAPAQKVEICHVPPGNPDNFHTITISENALAAHLEHGDFVGRCDELCATLCDDGDTCTIDDPADWDCEEQGCPPIPRSEINCDDGNECNTDSCDSASGQCVYTNDKVGQACNEDKFCPFLCDSDGVCQPDETVDCCEDDSWCDATYCNGNYCDLVDHTCRSTGDPCIDVVECTVDMCFNETGCQNEPMNELCDDEVYCTVDSCDPALGCRHIPDSVLCDDGIACTINEFCDPVTGCGSTADPSLCDDGVACTTESCDPITGCNSVANDTACNDGDHCTRDKCDPSSPFADGCRHDPIPECCNSDADCQPGEVCNESTPIPRCEPAQPSCFTAYDCIDSDWATCRQQCLAVAGCQPGVCDSFDPNLHPEFAGTVDQCINQGIEAACDAIDAYGRDFCGSVCPPPATCVTASHDGPQTDLQLKVRCEESGACPELTPCCGIQAACPQEQGLLVFGCSIGGNDADCQALDEFWVSQGCDVCQSP